MCIILQKINELAFLVLDYYSIELYIIFQI